MEWIPGRVLIASDNLRWIRIALSLAVFAMAAGCASDRFVRLRSQPYNPLLDRFQSTLTGQARPSPRTVAFLADNGSSARGTPVELLAAVRQIHQSNPSPESAHALAELNFTVGRAAEVRDANSAMEYYFDSMAAAYGYLFHSRFGPARNPWDPRFSDAVDLYNASLERMLRIADVRKEFVPGATLRLPVSKRSLQFVIASGHSSWEPRHYKRFEFVSDYDVEGLEHCHKTRGLGVPLIAVRRKGADRPEVERFYAEDLSFPVTAFVRFLEPEDSAVVGHACQLELHNPYDAQVTVVKDVTVPLATDITTPLAWFLDRPQFRYIDTWGLIRPDLISPYRGVYMLQPYQPDKIPVLMVHGIWSSPMTWMPMMNDLMSRPEIRDRYQFWFYLYPTGEPFWHNAANLREELASIRRVFDPQHQHDALGNTVVVGHSMGGLIARMLTIDSGDRFWRAVCNIPFEYFQTDPATRCQLQKLYFFRPHPDVRRVVTIATPFRGSSYVNRFTRWLARSFITLPGRTLTSVRNIVQTGRAGPNAVTSIDGLGPDSPILYAIDRSPPATGVAYHNIVAVRNPRSANLNDGVVDLASAMRTDVQSELVVQAHHSDVQRNPQTVNEVFRILMRHLQESGAAPPLTLDSDVQPLRRSRSRRPGRAGARTESPLSVSPDQAM